jgi:bifunctional pyridoxal-dependent enzyme with beta-cystathionase and maltose regulon repressor activities
MTDTTNNTTAHRDAIVAERDARRNAHVTDVTQAVERMLLTFGIHLNTDHYNDLEDYMRSLITGIEENGE